MLFKSSNVLHRFMWISLATIVTVSSSAKRELSYVKLDCDSEHLTVIKAKGDSDELYHVWSSKGSFVIMIVKANLNTSCTCSNATQNAVLKFEPKQLNSFAIVISKLIEYENSNSSYQTIHDFENLRWNKTLDGFSARYSLMDSGGLAQNNVELKLTANSDDEREETLPRLKYTFNSALIEVQLSDTETTFNGSRFGIGFSVVNNGTDNFTKDALSTVDDEYTPGIFKMINVLSKDSYFQWKPTVYTTAEHIKESSSITEESPLVKCSNDDIATDSLAYSFYGKKVLKMAQCMKVTFGETKDDFRATNFSSWVFNAGYGVPPEDEISILVIVVIIVGLGIPVLLLVGGGLYVFIKRCRVKNDDLSLSD